MSTESFNLIVKITSDGAGKLNAEVSSATGNLSKFKSETEKAKDETSRFGRVAETAAGFLAAKLTMAVKDFIGQSITMGATLQTVGAGFEALVDRASEGRTTLESLRSTTRGMVSDLDLMSAANKAVVLGLPVERFNELYDVATKLGPVMGRTVTQAVNDLALGIGRQSKMILDNLGIVISLETTYKAYAATLGKTIDQLTEAQKKQALFNAVMEQAQIVTAQLGDALSDDQQALMRWSASVDNAKTSLGIFLGQKIAPWLEAYSGLLDVATGRQKAWSQDVELMAQRIETSGGSLEDTFISVEGVWMSVADAVAQANDVVVDSWEETTERVVNNVEVSAKALEGYIDKVARVELTEREFTEMQRAAYDQRLDSLLDYYEDYYGVSEKEYDRILDVAETHFEDLRREEEESHRERLSEINRFYDDMLSEQKAFLDDIRNNRRTDLNDLELNFLLQKKALKDSLDAGKISRKNYNDTMEKLEKEYRNNRNNISDAYRIEELIAEKNYSKESQAIEEQRTNAIEAENRSLMLALALIATQEKKDFKDMYQTLLNTAKTYGIDLGNAFNRLANIYDTATSNMVADTNKLHSTIKSQYSSMSEIVREFQETPAEIREREAEEAAKGDTSGDTGGAASGGTGVAPYKGINIQSRKSGRNTIYSSALTDNWRFSRADVVRDLKKLGYAKGFEGWVNQATPMIVGEAGPEYVSVTPKAKMGGKGVGDVTVILPGVTNIGDPAQVRAIFRRVMLELSGER